MRDLKKIWHKVKGGIAITGISLILGLGVVSQNLNIETFEGPDGSVCIREVKAPVTELND